MTTAPLKTASVLAFERKLDPSDALFHAGDWQTRDNWQPLAVREKSVRGTISNRLKARDQDPAKLDAAIENPNLQTVDVAALPHDADTLRVSFTLRVLGGAGTPLGLQRCRLPAKAAGHRAGLCRQSRLR
ncbi:type I-F CRISPR-associated protein Cas7f/Csy3 [Pseudomonas sp. UBA6323]|uniref:type I-F CRISPR-associated protein Cas7f/Csy3 n=1 Tax=Pseudomonas sp. UBA6323 TaxID=1947329 RepID=UPI0025F95993|nr:type I-F CRISPR-associated protein Cas7f/Csy3 [Pseudomonas sp. UBA6323]